MQTPCYLVDYKKFKENCSAVSESFMAEWGDNVICSYSVKTNHYEGLMRFAHEEMGWYIETVSSFEYESGISLGVPAAKMILNGPNKGSSLQSAIAGDSIINIDNLDELEALRQDSIRLDGKRIGIRINVDLEAQCSGETTAGDEVSRFGIDIANGDFEKAHSLLKELGDGIKLGLHLHTSTKSRSIKVFKTLAEAAALLVKKYDLKLDFVDIGGGFFGGQVIEGKPLMSDYAKVICDTLKPAINPDEVTLILEPGASVLATCVSYRTKVVNVRDIRGERIVTVDGSMLHINPFMAKRNQPHELVAINDRPIIGRQIVSGSTCMEMDRLSDLTDEKELMVGDIIEYKNAGAYTMAFNSDFILEKPAVIDIYK